MFDTMFSLFFVIFFLIFAINIFAIFSAPYNKLIKERNNVNEKFASMDIYLKKRYDLVPNLVAVVKGYAKHENETLEKVIQSRNNAMQNNNTQTKVETENELTQNLQSIFMLSENYPLLKSDKHFLKLQTQLMDIENEISASRKSYNQSVSSYNSMVESFPLNILAKIFGFSKKEYFNITEIKERENNIIDL